MTDEAQGISLNCIALAGDIVAAYVSNNHVAAAELPALLRSVHGTLIGLTDARSSVAASSTVEIEKPSPVQIRRSVNQDGIVSFIDGRVYKTLKRHLTSHGLDPRGYRERYGLPVDYPMVAPSYAEQRSALAKSIGLGVPGGRSERQQADRKVA